MKNLTKTALLICFLVTTFNSLAQSEFTQDFISIGVIVSDVEVSKKFYTEVIGMTETRKFSVTGDAGKRLGLTNGIAFDVVILKLADSPNATEWKLLSFGKKATHPEQKYIHDDTGMQYVTIFVKSLNPFVERIKANNVTTLGETSTPQPLGNGRFFVLVQDPDGTFIELIGGFTE